MKGLPPSGRMLPSIVARPTDDPIRGAEVVAPKIWDATAGYPSGFYVYRLLDPRTDLPFYVGKGQRGRAWQHERSVQSGDLAGNARKVAKISEIIARGDSVTVEVVAIYDLESDALDHEFRLVDECPTLTNIAPGGGGGALSRQATARRTAARLLLMKRIKARERREAAEREVERTRSRYLGRTHSERDRAEVAQWLDGLSGRAADRFLKPRSNATEQSIATQAAKNEKKLSRRTRNRKRGKYGRSFLYDHQQPQITPLSAERLGSQFEALSFL